METERDREPLLPVQSLKGWDSVSAGGGDRALVDGTRGGRTATPWALADQGVWEALNSEASLNRNNHKHTPTLPRTYPWVKSALVTQAYQNALMKSPTIIKRHIHSPKHADIQAW